METLARFVVSLTYEGWWMVVAALGLGWAALVAFWCCGPKSKQATKKSKLGP